MEAEAPALMQPAAAAATIGTPAPPTPPSVPPKRLPACPDWRVVLNGFLVLSYLVACVYFVLLPDRPLVSQGVYIDENSLGVGNAAVMLADDAATQRQFDQMEARRRSGDRSAKEWILNELREQALPVEVSEFYPTGDAGGDRSTSNTSAPILSALYRSPKGDGRECFVLVCEYPTAPLASKHSAGGAGVGISGATVLMQLLRHIAVDHGYLYFHKDIILVFVPSEYAGVGSSSSSSPPTPSSSYYVAKSRSVTSFGQWMDAYHSGSTAQLVRSGRIQLVLTLDIPCTSGGGAADAFTPHQHSLDVVGFSGLTPNLDLPSVLLRVWESHSLRLHVSESIAADWEPVRPDERLANPVSRFAARHLPFLSKRFYSAQYQANETPIGSSYYELPRWLQDLTGVPLNDILLHGRYVTSLAKWKGLWRFMLSALAGGAPSSGAYQAHGLKYAIDSATIRAIPAPPRTAHASATKAAHLASAVETARALSAALRSFNSLVEKLHHSTYWYMLIQARDFVTMSKYIYVAVAGLVGLPLLGLALLLTQPTSSQRFAQSLGVLAWIYAGCALAYASAGWIPTLAAMGTPRANDDQQQQAQYIWLGLLAFECAIFWFVLLPRSTRRGSSNHQSADTSDASPIELLRDPALHHRTLSPAQRAALALVEPRGVELPESPSMLPLLPARLHPATPPPRFTASLDWRTLWSLTLLLASGTLVPVMVVNYSACLLTLVFLGPLVLVTQATLSPLRWYHLFQALRRADDGTPVRLRTTFAWEVLKYVVRSFLHIGVLAVCSPVTMLLVYAQFHGLALQVSLQQLLSTLAESGGGSTNLLWYTFFFTYLPMYTASWIQLGCSFEIDREKDTAKQEEKAIAKKQQ